MENLSLCCSLSVVLWICGAALTRCRMSPSIQCFQPLLFFSPFWTQTSLSPSQVTRDCMNQIINSVTLTRSLWTYKNKFKQCKYTLTVASYHSPSSSLKKPKIFKQCPNAFSVMKGSFCSALFSFPCVSSHTWVSSAHPTGELLIVFIYYTQLLVQHMWNLFPCCLKPLRKKIIGFHEWRLEGL